MNSNTLRLVCTGQKVERLPYNAARILELLLSEAHGLLRPVAALGMCQVFHYLKPSWKGVVKGFRYRFSS